jgi:hypothetical protein
MVRSRHNDSFDSRQCAADVSETLLAGYLETITLLQEEVARLEHEIQLREERQREATALDVPESLDGADDGAEMADRLENATRILNEVEGLKTELAGRDETIRLLLDELSQVEEAREAARAEWEHLAGWVAELERRVEGQDGDTLRQLENQLADQKHKAEALGVRSEQDRRAWEAQRQIYQEEIGRLQQALDQAARAAEAPGAHDRRVTDGPAADAGLVEALQAENLRFRTAWQELVERTPAADLAESLEAKLAETLKERRELRSHLEQVMDERERQRLEHEATVADLQARLSQALAAHAQRPHVENRPEVVSPEREIELRVRALRQCLLEVDQREKEERSQKHLISRLSRLWGRTGPR